MHTVFDIVGRFRVIRREYAGQVTPAYTGLREIVLVKDLNPNQAACGRSALESYMKVHHSLKPHVKTEGLERVWLVDWYLKERKVKDKEAA